jgi:nucleotide-binding universal stress UspA family protein
MRPGASDGTLLHMTSPAPAITGSRPARPLPFRRVLCAVTRSRHTPELVAQAVGLLDPEGVLTCMAVTDQRGTGRYEQASLSAAHAEEAVDEASRLAAPLGVHARAAVVHAGDVRKALVGAAPDHDLLVVGGRGGSRAAGILLGSCASYVVHAAPIPVLVARHRDEVPFPGVVLAASAGAGDEQTVRLAAQVAAAHHAQLVIGHSGDRLDGGVRDALALQAAAAAECTGSDPVVMSVPGDPSDRLVSMADTTGAGLVVLGNRGRRGVAALVSVSERVAHKVPASVLILRGRS